MILNRIFKSYHKFNIKSLSKISVKYISNSSKNNEISSRIGLSDLNIVPQIKFSKNISLNYCPTHSQAQRPSSSGVLLDGRVDSVPITSVRRPLTLIFAWMLAEDKHLEKYRQLWFRKGFDVLTVRTSPLDLLFPPIGGQIVAKKLVKCLSDLSSQYNEVVIHAFSVGGYQFGETLLQLREQECNDILNSFKGVIFDSMVFTRDAAPGLSRAITLNPFVQPMIEAFIYIFLKLFHNISVKHYLNSEEMLFQPLVKYQGLFLYSSNDLVSNVETNKKLAQSWHKLGNRVDSVCWDSSTHVLHYRDHQSEYEQHLDSFIKSLNLGNQRIH